MCHQDLMSHMRKVGLERDLINSLTHIYETQHKCGLSASLMPAQCDVYTMDHSALHITLTKHTVDNWEDMGPFIKSCQRATDWQETSDRSILFFIFSPTLQSLPSDVHTQEQSSWYLKALLNLFFVCSFFLLSVLKNKLLQPYRRSLRHWGLLESMMLASSKTVNLWSLLITHHYKIRL